MLGTPGPVENLTERVSHRSLDAHSTRAHRLHRPSSLGLITRKHRRTVGATWLTWPPIRRKRVAPYGRYLTPAAIPDLACLRRRPLPSSPLIQFRRHDPVFAPKARDRRRFSHAPVMTESRRAYKNYLYELFLREPLVVKIPLKPAQSVK